MCACIPVIPPLRRLKQDDCEFKAILDYIVSPGRPGLCSETLSQKQNAKKKEGRKDGRN
jgi:hypothetical protein